MDAAVGAGGAVRSGDGARVAVVVAAGGSPDLGQLAAFSGDEALLVVAADSGAAHAVSAGLDIDVLVGDLDSIDPALLASLDAAGVSIERHPVAKDATDLELAIEVALREGATTVHVVGGHGGRVDQSFANAFIVSSPVYAHVRMHAILDSARVSVVHGGGAISFDGAPGDVVTLLPMHGDAVGVRTSGLEYPLHGETLRAGTTRGVSNVLLDREATVSLEGGTLLVVRPGPELPPDGGME